MAIQDLTIAVIRGADLGRSAWFWLKNVRDTDGSTVQLVQFNRAPGP